MYHGNRKLIVLAVLASLLSVASAQIPTITLQPTTQTAQSNIDSTKKMWNPSAGLSLGIAAGINTQVAKGRKTDVGVSSNPNWAVSVLVPFGAGSSLGFGLDIGQDNYAFGNKGNSLPGSDIRYTERYTFFTISPYVNLNGFILGIGISSPSSVKAVDKDGAEYAVTLGYPERPIAGLETSVTASVDSALGSQTVLKVGYLGTVMEDKLGKLNVGVIAGYPFGDLYKKIDAYAFARDRQDGGILIDGTNNNKTNPHPVSVSLVIQFLFKIPVN